MSTAKLMITLSMSLAVASIGLGRDVLSPSPSTDPPATTTGSKGTTDQLRSVLKQRLEKKADPVAMQDAPEWFQNMMHRILIESLPAKYVHEKDWGGTTKRWDGLHIQRKGPFRVYTKRKWKEVNHGTWKRHEISLIEPDKHLTLRIENVHDAGDGEIAFEVSLTSKLHALGRISKWTKGVQIYSVSAEADAEVSIRVWCEISIRLDMSRFPPDVVVEPEVTRADLDVKDFELQRVSKLDGPIVKQLSRSVRKLLLDKVAEKRDRLPEKINRQLDKNRDKMRLSLSDFAAEKWNALTTASERPRESASEPQQAHREHLENAAGHPAGAQ